MLGMSVTMGGETRQLSRDVKRKTTNKKLSSMQIHILFQPTFQIQFRNKQETQNENSPCCCHVLRFEKHPLTYKFYILWVGFDLFIPRKSTEEFRFLLWLSNDVFRFFVFGIGMGGFRVKIFFCVFVF